MNSTTSKIALVVVVVSGLVVWLWWQRQPAPPSSLTAATAPSNGAAEPAASVASTAHTRAAVAQSAAAEARDEKERRQPGDGSLLSSVTLDPQPSVTDDVANPNRWRKEAMTDALAPRLKKLLEAIGRKDAAAAQKFLTEKVTLTPLGQPQQLRIGTLRVSRWPEQEAVSMPRGKAVAALLARLTSDKPQRLKVKIEGVNEAGGKTISTRIAADGAGEQRRARWLIGLDDSEPPLIMSIKIVEDERARRSSPLFVDATSAVLSGLDASARDVLLADADRWLKTMQASYSADPIGHQGLAVGDVNGDGRDDVYICSPSGVPNRLLVQQPDGTVRDEALARGVALLDLSRSALFADFDNDGDQDLVVSTRATDSPLDTAVLYFEGSADGRFSEPDEILRGGDIHSMVAADYDGDGDLDIYLTALNGDVRGSGGFGLPVPYHDAQNGGANRLLQNQGPGKFVDVTSRVGLSVRNNRWSYAASWEDYDNDGDQDLYVANDFGRNNLYRNDGGKFREVAAEAGVEDLSSGMSVSWGDFDRDGDMDLYVSNMYSAAGRRLTTEANFQPDAPATVRQDVARHARGNTLLRNDGKGRFEDVSARAGTMVGRWAWGALLADFNGDGYEDIAVANGMFTRPDPGDL